MFVKIENIETKFFHDKSDLLKAIDNEQIIGMNIVFLHEFFEAPSFQHKN